MSSIVLSQFAVRNSNGGVDTEATVDKFRTALSQFVADVETEETSIAQAIDAVLTANHGINTNMSYVTSQVAMALNAVEPTAFSTMKTKVAEYIRANSCGEKNGQPIDTRTKEVLSSPRRFFVGKGVGGGVSTWEQRLERVAAKTK